MLLYHFAEYECSIVERGGWTLNGFVGVVLSLLVILHVLCIVVTVQGKAEILMMST